MPLTKVSFSMINGACVNVLDFGAKGDAVTDDTAAIQAALDYAGTFSTDFYGANVYLPGGQYLVTDTLIMDKDRVGLIGDGNGKTLIVRNGSFDDTLLIDNGEIIYFNTVKGITFYHDITTGGVMSGAHIRAEAPLQINIEDCNLINGAYGIICAGGVYVNISDCHLQGQYDSGVPAKNSTTGLYFIRTANTGAVPIPTIVNVSDTQVNASWDVVNAAYQYGCVINAAEEMHFTNCTFNTGPNSNLLIQQTSDNSSILELTFTTCFFDTSEAYNVWIEGSQGNGSNVISRLRFIGCGFNGEGVVPVTNPGIGLFVDGTNRGGTFPQCLANLQIVGCTFQAFYSHAIVLSGYDILLTGNTIYGNNTSLAANGSGVILSANAHRVNITGNTIGGEFGVAFMQEIGIAITNGASDFVIANNDVTANTVAGIIDSSTTTNKRIVDNLGFNGNRAATAPTMPASAVNFTNPYGSPAVISIYGGTVSSIKLNGTQILASTAGSFNSFTVGANDVLNITYAAAPSWIWWPQ